MKHRYLRLLSWMLVGTLLYAQMAVAAYACPNLGASVVTNLSMAPMAETNSDANVASTTMPNGDCAGMQGALDPSAPKLCADHCNYGHQSDQTPNLMLPTVLLTPLYVSQPTLLASMSLQRTADLSAHLSALAEASPPLSVLHCRFQI